jgi:hypothetical protein
MKGGMLMAPIEQVVLKQQVHTALLELFGHKIARDADGDWPIVMDGRHVYISLELAPAPHALVFSRAASNTSEDCRGEVHDLNASAAWAKIVRANTGDVLVYQRVLQAHITGDAFQEAIGNVVTCAKDCGPMLQTVYGTATTPTPDAR